MNATPLVRLKRNVLPVTLAVVTLAAFTPNRSRAARHVVVDFEDVFVDLDSYCVPVRAHAQGRFILGFEFPQFTMVQPVKIDWTNLETGKTVLTSTAGRLVTTFASDTIYRFSGEQMVQQRDGTWVDAGLVEYLVELNPRSGGETNITIRLSGNRSGGFADALSSALQ